MPQVLTDAIAPTSDPLAVSDRQIIADVLTSDRQEYTSPEEIETVAIALLWNHSMEAV